jgi:tetratricopeptide (TPR) repeat protein
MRIAGSPYGALDKTMKIVYQGFFLGEGLRELGHEVIPIVFNGRNDANEQIAAICHDPDFILIEQWGSNTPIPPGLDKCAYRLVAYCIDSSINEYILSDYLHLFDDVFVDQRSSVEELKYYGISSIWLPLCVSSTAFRKPRKKVHDITFVGSITDYRTKRKNLLKHIQQHFPVHMVKGVSESEMQDVFSRSKIVLNENFFPGFTLRILQGMASGSLVLTEAGGDGVSDYFTDGIHLVYYSPADILDKIKQILDNHNKYRRIAEAGRAACAKQHTSKARAAKFLSCLAPGDSNREQDAAKRKFYLAKTKYTVCLRFGGEYSHSVKLLNQLRKEENEPAAWAAFTLGNIAARRNRHEMAVRFYMEAVNKGYSSRAYLKLAMLCLTGNKIEQALRFIRKALSDMSRQHPGIKKLEIIPQTDDGIAEILFFIARLYAFLQRPFQVGYLKMISDRYPDTSLEIAMLAWRIKPSTEILDFLLSVYTRYHIKGELLPELLYAIDKKIASKRHIKCAGELAAAYYDINSAQKLKKLLQQGQSAT